MFNSVVQHRHPHPFPSPYHSHSSLESHGANLPFPRATDYEDTNTTPDSASSRSFQQPRQYAHPLRSPPTIPDQTRLSNSSTSRIEASEYMLRRKTPNGTLAAGYDGAPVEWARRPHAMKHILMPTSGTSQSYSGQDPSRNGRVSYGSANSSGVKADEQRRWSSSKSQASSPGIWGALPREDQGQTNSCASRNTEAAGMDSILSQIPLSQPCYKPMAPNFVSTGLHPMWPPIGDHKVLNLVGPYGSYWPNESSALSNYSNLRYPSSSGWCNAPIQTRSGLQDQAGQNYRLEDDVRFESSIGPDALSIYSSGHDMNIRHAFFPNQDSFTGQKRHISTDYVPSLPEHFNSTSLPYRGKSSQIRENSSRGEAVHSPIKSSCSLNTTELEWNMPTDTLQHREKARMWAHRIYINLLASLHQARKHGHNKNSICRQPQVCIYPKPPGQHFSTSRNVDHNSHIETQVEEDIIRYGTDQPSFRQKLMKPSLYLSRKETAFNDQSFSPQAEENFMQHGRYHLELQSGPRQTIPFQAHYNHQQNSPDQRRNSAVSVPSSPYYQVHSTNQPSADARAAIDVITTICQESGWQWIDGLLLGGCLAYGLTEYEKALEWFSRVLICDSK